MQLCASSHKIKNKDLATWRRKGTTDKFLFKNKLPNLSCLGYLFFMKDRLHKKCHPFQLNKENISADYISLYPITGSKLFLRCNLFDWIWWGHLLILMQFKHNKCILKYISSPFPHRLFQIRTFNKCIYLALTYQIKYTYSILTFP